MTSDRGWLIATMAVFGASGAAFQPENTVPDGGAWFNLSNVESTNWLVNINCAPPLWFTTFGLTDEAPAPQVAAS